MAARLAFSFFFSYGSAIRPQETEPIGKELGAQVVATALLAGGDVAESFRVSLDNGRTVFAKTHAAPPPNFFSTEAAGLLWLAEPEVIRIPKVLFVSDDPPLLVLEWINAFDSPPDEVAFGRQLASLHQSGAKIFGRADGRTTGSRALPNDPCDTWAEFFAARRLQPLARLAHDEGVLGEAALRALQRVTERMDELAGPAEPPARLHGDLWAGNRMVDNSGASWLIDPACFGGSQEFDLAMMKLFGGFGEAAFTAYDEISPLANEWQSRIPLWQLAPLLVHAIKFGGSYVPACEQIIKSYS